MFSLNKLIIFCIIFLYHKSKVRMIDYMENSRNKNKNFKISPISKKILVVFFSLFLMLLSAGIKFYFLSKSYISDIIDLNILSEGLIQNSFYILVEGIIAALVADYLSKK